MNKQIFDEKDQIIDETETDFVFQGKQEFIEAEWIDDESENNPEVEAQFEQQVSPPLTMGKTLLKLTALLFTLAVLAQSVQWLWDSFQQRQWIYFAFALVSLAIVLLGLAEFMAEWRRLVRLKKRLILQQEIGHYQQIATGIELSNQPAKNEPNPSVSSCLAVADSLQIDERNPQMQVWKKQIEGAYNEKEIVYLFSQNVLKYTDEQAKKLVTKIAMESAIVVAVSPLAIVDIFFVAWRNLRMINQIAQIYRIELGYFTRIRLLRMVLLNMVFAGATEVVQDMGLDWLSQDLTAKLSSRVAQGIGIGLLTARLGIKAIDFCRPIYFFPEEKLKLRHIQKELLQHIKATIFTKTAEYDSNIKEVNKQKK